ncbi:MAG: type II secretion system F family protein, partial [Lachnospiraceae bacterium]|nr:type II secretion system F family protein [Lachnospiraceae bacterium]
MEQEKKIGRKLDNNELSYFCGQMALILKSGISALEGIDMMKDDNSSEEDKAILDNIKNDMIQNGSLFQSMENTGLFPNYMLHMVRIGEQTGNLDEVMHSLQEHYEREESIRVSIQNALIYPFIMAGMIIVVILILLVRVMPIFNQVF